MLINTFDVAAAPGGAVFEGACSPWTSLSALGTGRVLMQTRIPAAGTPAARRAALRAALAVMTQLAAAAATLPTAIDIRKQYVHKTRKSAGGDGAMGPYPEREPA